MNPDSIHGRLIQLHHTCTNNFLFDCIHTCCGLVDILDNLPHRLQASKNSLIFHHNNSAYRNTIVF